MSTVAHANQRIKPNPSLAFSTPSQILNQGAGEEIAKDSYTPKVPALGFQNLPPAKERRRRPPRWRSDNRRVPRRQRSQDVISELCTLINILCEHLQKQDDAPNRQENGIALLDVTNDTHSICNGNAIGVVMSP